MSFLKWLAAGFIGAAIGGAVWVGVGYFAEAEVGYIAWGIGLLAGIGVRVAADEDDLGMMSGFAAIISASAVIFLSKYLVVSMLVNDAMGEIPTDFEVTPNDMIVGIADEVVTEWETAGKPVNWPPGMTIDEASEEVHYPKDVWAEASNRWNEIPPEEQRNQMNERKEAQQQFIEGLSETIKEQAFEESFNGFDLLWFGLAALTAFRVGGSALDD